AIPYSTERNRSCHMTPQTSNRRRADTRRLDAGQLGDELLGDVERLGDLGNDLSDVANPLVTVTDRVDRALHAGDRVLVLRVRRIHVERDGDERELRQPVF